MPPEPTATCALMTCRASSGYASGSSQIRMRVARKLDDADVFIYTQYVSANSATARIALQISFGFVPETNTMTLKIAM